MVQRRLWSFLHQKMHDPRWPEWFERRILDNFLMEASEDVLPPVLAIGILAPMVLTCAAKLIPVHSPSAAVILAFGAVWILAVGIGSVRHIRQEQRALGETEYQVYRDAVSLAHEGLTGHERFLLVEDMRARTLARTFLRHWTMQIEVRGTTHAYYIQS